MAFSTVTCYLVGFPWRGLTFKTRISYRALDPSESLGVIMTGVSISSAPVVPAA